jgi:hypothetical protein
MSLSDKNVLLLSPQFFGYGQHIATELQHLGATVDLFDTRPNNSAFTKIALRLAPFLVMYQSLAYHKKILEHNKTIYDYILVIRGEGMTVPILKLYRKNFPNSKFVYYTYDALSENRLPLVFKEFFDRCASFDPIDCQTHTFLEYEPLFYIQKYAKVEDSEFQRRKYDVSSIGTFRLDRYTSMCLIHKALPAQSKHYYYHYHPSRTIFYIFRFFFKTYARVNQQQLHFQPLSADEVADVLSESKAVIDIQKPHQRGLTMRTIEMLGANRKLITTNPNVKNHDFYNASNILVVDPHKPLIPSEFFTVPYQKIPQQIYSRYSLASWLKRILR